MRKLEDVEIKIMINVFLLLLFCVRLEQINEQNVLKIWKVLELFAYGTSDH